MCLSIARTARAKVAKEPIKVYKVLEYGNVSPFYQFTYRANRKYSSDLLVFSCNSNIREVENGFHTFANLKDALQQIEKAFFSNMKIVEMYIPIGASYYKGKWEGGEVSYASSEIETKSLKAVKG